MITRLLASSALLLAVTACATASKLTIADRLEDLGLSRDRSVCMADELDDRLNDDQLAKFARFTVRLEEADTALAAIGSLRQIEDAKIARAVTASAFSCALT